MPAGQAVIMILVMALATFALRLVPFALFSGSKTPSRYVLYLGSVLPAAMIGMLVVYCLKDVSILNAPYGAPEAIGIAAVAFLHRWKGNIALSLGGGTALYIWLSQHVFAV
jgi:branched-subunit amino acid transport protein AzlD